MFGLLTSYWRYMAIVSIVSAGMATVTPIGSSLAAAGGDLLNAVKAPIETLDGLAASLSPDASERVKVTRVIDGDTFEASFDGDSRRVRILQIDTPESVKSNTPVECYAKKASSFTKKKLTGKRVTLIYSREREDKYGRVLAYVELNDVDFGARLLRNGYARTLTIKPNSDRTEKYEDLEADARRKQRGLWGACAGE